MLTSYMVTCPHPGCNWFGSLLPKGDLEPWRRSLPGRSIVDFECPHCQGTWQARLIGDDIEILPLEEVAVPVG